MGQSHAQTVVVQIPGGEAMFEKSEWVQSELTKTVSGWYSRPINPLRGRVLIIPKLADPAFAFGRRIDLNALQTRLQRPWHKETPLILSLDEVMLAQRYQVYCTSKQGEKLLHRAWDMVDKSLAIAAESLKPNSQIIIIATPDPTLPPSPSDRLMPVVLKGRQFGKGALTDRRTGLKGWSPHIHEAIYQNSPPHQTTVIWGDQTEIPTTATLRALRSHLLDQARRNDYKNFLIGLCLLAMIAGTVGIIRTRPVKKPPAASNIQMFSAPPGASKPSAPKMPPPKPVRAFILWEPWMPLFVIALLMSSLLPGAQSVFTPWGTSLAMVLGTSALLAFALWLRAPMTGIGVASGIGLVIFALDILTGSRWVTNGMLGYSLLDETRFNGLGTEYAALLLGGAMLFLGCWLQIEGLPAVGIYLLSIVSAFLAWGSDNPSATLSACAALIGYTVFLPHKSSLMKRWIGLAALPLGFAALTLRPAFLTVFTDSNVPVKTWVSGFFSWDGVLLAALLGAVWMIRKRQLIDPVTSALERAWLCAVLVSMISSLDGIRFASGLILLYWVFLAARYWQESTDLTEN